MNICYNLIWLMTVLMTNHGWIQAEDHFPGHLVRAFEDTNTGKVHIVDDIQLIFDKKLCVYRIYRQFTDKVYPTAL